VHKVKGRNLIKILSKLEKGWKNGQKNNAWTNTQEIKRTEES